MPLPRLPALAAVGLLLPGLASAACPAPYTVDNLLADLMAVEGALRASDDPTVTKSASALEGGLPCLEAPLPRPIAGRAYRAIGAGLLVGGQQDRATGWLETAADLEPSFDFGIEDLPDPHPVRTAWMAAKSSPNGEEVPLGGTWTGVGYVDGRKLTAPAAREGRPHLVQVQGEGGLQGWVVTGTEFPPAAVTGVAAVADAGRDKPEKEPKAPKEPKEPKASTPRLEPEPVAESKPPKPAKTRPAPQPAPVGSVVTGVRNRPPEKTPLMIGGAAITLGGGGVLYYLAYKNVQDFNAEEFDSAAVQSSWKDARLFTIASLSVAAVGAGTFTWGVILDGGGTPLPAFQVRF